MPQRELRQRTMFWNNVGRTLANYTNPEETDNFFFAIFGWEEGRGLRNVNILMPFFLQNAISLMITVSLQDEILPSRRGKGVGEGTAVRLRVTASSPSYLWGNITTSPNLCRTGPKVNS